MYVHSVILNYFLDTICLTIISEHLKHIRLPAEPDSLLPCTFCRNLNTCKVVVKYYQTRAVHPLTLEIALKPTLQRFHKEHNWALNLCTKNSLTIFNCTAIHIKLYFPSLCINSPLDSSPGCQDQVGSKLLQLRHKSWRNRNI